MRKNTVQIDGKKLRSLLNAKRMNMATTSKECGFCNIYLSNCIKAGKIPKRSAILLEKTTGISLDEYEAKIEKVEEQPEPAAKAIDILTADELKILIFNTVTEALKEHFA